MLWIYFLERWNVRDWKTFCRENEQNRFIFYKFHGSWISAHQSFRPLFTSPKFHRIIEWQPLMSGGNECSRASERSEAMFKRRTKFLYDQNKVEETTDQHWRQKVCFKIFSCNIWAKHGKEDILKYIVLLNYSDEEFRIRMSAVKLQSGRNVRNSMHYNHLKVERSFRLTKYTILTFLIFTKEE